MKILVGSIKGHQTLKYKSVFFDSICQIQTMISKSMVVFISNLSVKYSKSTEEPK